MDFPNSGVAGVVGVVIASEMQFRSASVAGGTVCGHALHSHPGVALRFTGGSASPLEEQQHAACTAAGAPAWCAGLAAAGAGSALLLAGGALALPSCDRA